jgi:exopolysaccharide biosynthesis polyprenyl glycosylphosphotransferase
MSTTGQRIAFGRETEPARREDEFVANFRPQFSARRALTKAPFSTSLGWCAAAADFFTVTAAVFAAGFLSLPLHSGGRIGIPAGDIFLAAMLVVLLLKCDGAYRGVGSMLRIRETERAIRVPMQAVSILLPLSFFSHPDISRSAILGSVIVVPPFLILQKQIFASAARTLFLNGNGGKRVAVYGAGDAGRRIVSTLFNSPWLGLRPVVAIEDDPESAMDRVLELGYRGRSSVPVRYGPATSALLKSCGCEILVIANANLAPESLSRVLCAAKRAEMRVACVAHPEACDGQNTAWIDLDGLLVTSVADAIAPRHYQLLKRITDVVLSSLLLVVLAPLFLMIALLIRLDSRGRALFIQKRVGLNGRPFDIYKFRSMYCDAPKYELSPASPSDQRITRMGRFLRRTSLDELPQLINVLLGDMSLVGPRPEMPFIADFYNQRERQRLRAIPGITGLWQLSADRVSAIHRNVEYDLYYIRNRSFFLDIAILLHTLLFAMRGV